MLVGNKCDKPDRVVTEEKGRKLADDFSMSFFETSAKTNQNVDEVFNFLIQEILKANEDKLDFKNNKNIKNAIGDEIIYYSDKILENTLGIFSKIKERNFLVTDNAIYNFKGNNLIRKTKIKDLRGITISMVSNQFIIHCNQNDYDYLYIYEDRKIIIRLLEYLYENSTNYFLLFSQKNEKDLSKFVVTEKKE